MIKALFGCKEQKQTDLKRNNYYKDMTFISSQVLTEVPLGLRRRRVAVRTQVIRQA